MALIKCPKCKREVSSASINCIYCGHRIKSDPVLEEVENFRSISNKSYSSQIKLAKHKSERSDKICATIVYSFIILFGLFLLTCVLIPQFSIIPSRKFAFIVSGFFIVFFGTFLLIHHLLFKD